MLCGRKRQKCLFLIFMSDEYTKEFYATGAFSASSWKSAHKIRVMWNNDNDLTKHINRQAYSFYGFDPLIWQARDKQFYPVRLIL